MMPRTPALFAFVLLTTSACATPKPSDPPVAERAPEPAVATSPETATPANPEPANPEPANPEPANPEPANPEPANPDASQWVAPTPRLPIVLIRDRAISTLTPGEKPRATKLRPGGYYGGAVGLGSTDPVVSPDGRFIAFNDARDRAHDRGELVITPIDALAAKANPQPLETLTNHRGGYAVDVYITGWSADGNRLLYAVREAMSEDLVAPKGLVSGFFLWQRGAGPPQHLPWLESADLLLPDGLAVLRVVDAPGAAGKRTLTRVSLADGAAQVLATRDDPYAFGQLEVVGDTLVFAGHGTIEVMPLSAPADAKVLIRRGFAEAQWPRLSPDRRHVAWQHSVLERGIARKTLMVTPVDGGDALTLHPIAGPLPEVAWFDDTRLVLCDSDGVHLVGLYGQVERLAPKGTCFIPRGAR